MTAEELTERSYQEFPEDSELSKMSPDEYAMRIEAKNGEGATGEGEDQEQPVEGSRKRRKSGNGSKKAAAALRREAHLATIPLDLITINENNPRLNREEALDELMANIEHVGLLHPITVVKAGEKFLIIDGHRRFRAMQSLGMKEIDAYVIEISEDKREMCPLAADVGTQKLRPLEVARECKRLMEATGMKQQELTQILNLGKGAISDYLSLLTLPEEIQREYDGGTSDGTDGESDEFGRRTSQGGIRDSRVLAELAKVPRPYQVRLYYRLKRERAKEHPPNRNELVKMTQGVRTNQFRNMSDDLKNIFLEGSFITWEHLTMIGYPDGADFEKYGDVGLSEDKKIDVARWVERDKKSLKDTRKHLLKMLHEKWIAQQKEQGRSKPEAQESDAEISGILKEAKALVKKLGVVRSAIETKGGDQVLLRDLRKTLESLRRAANEVVTAIDALKDEAGEVGRNSGDGGDAMDSADADSAAADGETQTTEPAEPVGDNNPGTSP
jgi:ParB/RepB/Spo0J family partition protein